MNLTLTRRMIGAEVLKLRRSRGVMGFALVLTVGVVVLAYGFTAIQHASDPSHHRAAGGVSGFTDGVRVLGLFFGMLAAILVGAEAGTADRASGVFRDLVVTGRSRLALFAVRLPAALIVTLSLSAAAYALVLVATFVFAGSQPTPSLGLILQGAGWVALATSIVAALAVGVGSLTGSRAVTITAVIGWQAVASNILLNITSLGSVREGILTAAVTHLIPVKTDRISVTMTTASAVIVLIFWAVIPAALGAWRTRTVDA